MSDKQDQLQVRRTLRALTVLFGREVMGLRPSEIAKGIQESPSTVTRLMAAMEQEGYAERVPGREDAWRLGPKLVQGAIAHQRGLAEIQRQLNETTQRFSRVP